MIKPIKLTDAKLIAVAPEGYEACFFLGDVYAFSREGPTLHLNAENVWVEVPIVRTELKMEGFKIDE